MNTTGMHESAKAYKAEYQTENLIESDACYDWKSVKPSVVCACFKFVLQLVLVGCCGSFLFGFNIGLLNLSLPVIFSSFQICGAPSGFSKDLYDILRNENIAAAEAMCNSRPTDCEQCRPLENDAGQLIGYNCPGGYTDSSCLGYKWYVAFIQAAIMLGGIIGALGAGRIIKNGRRTLFLVMITVFGVGTINSVCSNSFSAFMWARIIIGIGIGLSSVISPTYISEMTSRKERGKYGVFHQLAITVGIFIGIILGLPMIDPADQVTTWIPDTFAEFWWRFLLGLNIVPVIISFYLLGFVYCFETPVFYAEQKRYNDVYEAFDRILDGKDVQEEVDKCIENVKTGAQFKKQGITFMSAISDPKYRFVILVGLAISGFQQFGGINVFMTSSAGLFRSANLSKSMQQAMTIIMAFINSAMTFPTVLLIERVGRRTLLLCGSALQFLCVVPCAIAYWVESDIDNPSPATKGLAIFGVIGFVLFFAVGFGPIVWVYLFEIYPMEIKDAATSAATAFNWVAAIIMVFVSNVIHNQISFTLFALLQLLATLFIFFCMKETKGLPLGTSPYIQISEKIV